MTQFKTLNQLTVASLPALTVVAGEDVGLYAHLKTTLLDRIGYEPSDLAYAYFDMAESDYATVAMDLESLPFFADQKVVILDNFQDITTDKKAYLDEKELKAFEAYLENPVDTTRLVVLAAGKLDGKRRLVKLLKRDGLVFEAAPLKEADLRSHFLGEIKRLGLVFEPGAFDLLLAKSQMDFGQINQNLLFLKDYKLDSSAISQKDIEEAIPKTLQDNIFDLTQLILGGRIDAARELVRDLRLQGEEEVKLIAIMLGQLRLFLQVQLLARKGQSEGQMVADLSESLGRKVNPYQVKFALRDSRGLSVAQLKQSVLALIEADYQIKTGVYDKDYLFDIALLKIAGQKS